MRVGDKLWTNWNKAPLKLWQTQLNYVVFCASSACGVSLAHLNYTKHPMIESLSALTTRIEAKQSYPKDDMRRQWVKKSTDREKAMKQIRYIDSKLEYLISKRKFTIEVIQDCERTLQKLGVAIMSDITTC